MASGSQVYSGIWADFPQAPRNSSRVMPVRKVTPTLGAALNTSEKPSVPKRRPDEDDGDSEPNVTNAVDDERLVRSVGGRLAVIPEANQQV